MLSAYGQDVQPFAAASWIRKLEVRVPQVRAMTCSSSGSTLLSPFHTTRRAGRGCIPGVVRASSLI
jgi:hypothetical protein